jgi:hypothetical protein
VPDDPLANLRDIHLPQEPGWWPPAPGWWLLGALVLLTPILWRMIQAFRGRRRKPRYRSAALQELDQYYQAYQSTGGKPAFVQAVSALLKRVALQCHDPAQVAALSGRQWADFLTQDQDAAVRRNVRLALEQAYSREVSADAAALYRFAQTWISAQGRF